MLCLNRLVFNAKRILIYVLVVCCNQIRVSWEGPGWAGGPCAPLPPRRRPCSGCLAASRGQGRQPLQPALFPCPSPRREVALGARMGRAGPLARLSTGADYPLHPNCIAPLGGVGHTGALGPRQRWPPTLTCLVTWNKESNSHASRRPEI